jgi:hypothetical protein
MWSNLNHRKIDKSFTSRGSRNAPVEDNRLVQNNGQSEVRFCQHNNQYGKQHTFAHRTKPFAHHSTRPQYKKWNHYVFYPKNGSSILKHRKHPFPTSATHPTVSFGRHHPPRTFSTYNKFKYLNNYWAQGKTPWQVRDERPRGTEYPRAPFRTGFGCTGPHYATPWQAQRETREILPFHDTYVERKPTAVVNLVTSSVASVASSLTGAGERASAPLSKNITKYLRGHPDCINRPRSAKVPRKGLFEDSSCDESFDDEDNLPAAKKRVSLNLKQGSVSGDTQYDKSPLVDLSEDTSVEGEAVGKEVI